MHKEILTKEQLHLLPLIRAFGGDFGLVGGTAIALQIGHRRSIDFDMFSLKEFTNSKIKRKIMKSKWRIDETFRDESGQFTFSIKNVQFTFYYYPFTTLKFSEDFESIAKTPDLLSLAAMKAYALGRRAKWKDYVDLYFIIRKYHSIDKIVQKSKEIFLGEFNERIFREHLSYFEDVSYEEQVDFLPGFEVDDEKIKKELIEFSIQ